MFSSIRSRLFLLVLLAALPALGLALYTSQVQHNQAAVDAQAEALRLTRLAASNQEALIEAGQQLLITLAQLPVVRGEDAAACDAFFASLLPQYSYYANLGVVAPNGDLLCSALPHPNPVSYADRDWYQEAVKTGDFVIGQFVVGRLTGKAILPLAYPGLDESGHVQFVVISAIDLAWLEQLAAEVELPEGSVFTMIDRHGVILARYPDPQQWVGQAFPEAQIVEAILATRGEGTAEATGVDGVQRLYAFTRLGGEGEVNYPYVSIGIPTKIAYAEADRMLIINLAGLGLVTLMALAAAGVFGNVFIMRRVNSLLRAAQKLASGDLKTRAEVPRENSEFNLLAQAFDRMAASLEQRQAERNQAEERYRHLFETMMNGFAVHEIITDENGKPCDYRFLEVNPAFEKNTGLQAEAVVGKTVREALPGVENYWIEAYGEVALSGTSLHLENYSGPLDKHFEVFAYSPRKGQFATILMDVTERKRSQEELLRLNRALRMIIECNQILVRADDETSLLHEICQTLIITGGYRMAWVGYAEQDEARAVRPVAQAGYEEGYLATLNITWADAERGRGPTGTAIRTGKVCKVNNILSDPAFEPWRAEAIQRGYSASISLPLLNEGKAFGALNIHSAEIGAFEEQEEHLLRELAGDLAYGILALRTRAAHQEAEQALRESEARYHNTLDNMLEGCQIIGYDWRYLYVNDAVAGHGRQTREKLLGHTMMEVYPGIEKTDLFAALRRCMDDRTPIYMENEFTYPDGTSGWFELSIQPAPEGIFILSVDITERKQAEAKIRQSAARAEALARTASRLNAQLDFGKVLEAICEETANALDVAAVSIYLYDEQSDTFSPAWAIGIPHGAAGRLPVVPRALYEQFAINPSEPIVFQDIGAIPNLPSAALFGELDVRSHASVNLLREGQLIGFLNVNTIGEARYWTEDEIALLKGLADQSAQALVNARLFNQAQARLSRVQALRKIDAAITTTLDLQTSINKILEQITVQTGADAACVLLFNSLDQTLDFVAGRGFHTDALQHTRLRMGEGHAGQAAQERRILNIPNLRDRKTDFLRSPAFGAEKFVAYFAIPLIAKGVVNGVLEIFHRAPLEPDQEWLDFLETLAGQVAIAIDNASLFSDLKRSNWELLEAYDATIEGWSRALDLRDNETEGHTQRVTKMTLRLAQAIGVNETELVHLRRGALLHDIGKLGVPDHILFKPGPLTEEEWVLMRKHPLYAYEMLVPIDYLRPALDIPYFHHEKWDGSGYPHGLKGEQIPLAARIFAVVDVWDALISDRPYRKAWTKEKAFEYIREQAGKHFDPRVVEAFFEMVRSDQQ
ncbi:MAG: GAF domain-containing protein [Anaerolineales bacterium]|nr:GAF domain-containing protein [Anaerolineales bacterium]